MLTIIEDFLLDQHSRVWSIAAKNNLIQHTNSKSTLIGVNSWQFFLSNLQEFTAIDVDSKDCYANAPFAKWDWVDEPAVARMIRCAALHYMSFTRLSLKAGGRLLAN